MINSRIIIEFIFNQVNMLNTVYILLALGESVISLGCDEDMLDCNHEEADSRILVHVQDAFAHGAKSVEVRTVDTDVVVILIGKYHCLQIVQPKADIWVAFGMGKKFRYYSINRICSSLGQQKSQAMPMYHAFTGCDTTSSFRERGKKINLAGLAVIQ